MYKAQSEDSSVDVSTPSITPEKPRNDSRNDKGHDENEGEVVPMLPAHNGVLGEVAHISDTGLAARLEEHPTDMGVEEALVGVVGVKVGVGVAVVCAVATRPPLDGSFHCTSTEHGKNILQRQRRVVGTVRPKTVVSGGDAEAGEVVVENGKEKSLPAEGSEHGTNEADEGGDGEDGETEPVDFLVPVLPGNRRKGLLGLQGVGDIVVGDVEV